MQRKEGAFLQTPALPFHFWLPLLPPILPFCFKCFLLASFSSQVEEKEKKKPPIEKKKNAEKGENFPFSSCSTLSLLVLASALLFQTLSPSIFFFSNKKKEKENHREEKKCREGRELTFKLSLCLLTFGSCFWPPISTLFISSAFSSTFSSFQVEEKKKENTKKKKP